MSLPTSYQKILQDRDRQSAPLYNPPLSPTPYSNPHLTLGCTNTESSTNMEGPICPLTKSLDVDVLEEFPSSLLIDCYQRDLGLNVVSEFKGIESLQLCRCRTSDLMFFYPSITGSPEFYRQLQTFNWYFPETKFEYDHAASWITPDQHILDIGCGAAQFVRKLSGTSYTGLDPNYISTKDIEHTGLHIHSETIDEHAKTNGHRYDVVCTFQVLEHVSNPREFLAAALACLKPGGLLILGVPSAESYVTRIANFVLNAPPHHVTWWTDQSLHHLADQFHLSILDLAHAPVETWETRLYWMQRMLEPFLPKNPSHFTESGSRRLSNIAAYIGAGFIMPLTSPPVSAQGSSVVMIAQKSDVSLC